METHVTEDLTSSVEKLETDFRKVIVESANKHIGMKKVSGQSKPWMTPEIRKAIAERNRLRKTMKDNRKEFTEKGREVQQLIKEEKTKRWKEFVESIDDRTTEKQMWWTIT